MPGAPQGGGESLFKQTTNKPTSPAWVGQKSRFPLSNPVTQNWGKWVVYPSYVKAFNHLLCQMLKNQTQGCGCVLGAWLVLKGSRSQAAGRATGWRLLKILKFRPHLELPWGTGWSPRRLTPGQGCPGDAPCCRGHCPPNHLGTPGDCMSHPSENHRGHSQPLTLKAVNCCVGSQGRAGGPGVSAPTAPRYTGH